MMCMNCVFNADRWAQTNTTSANEHENKHNRAWMKAKKVAQHEGTNEHRQGPMRMSKQKRMSKHKQRPNNHTIDARTTVAECDKGKSAVLNEHEDKWQRQQQQQQCGLQAAAGTWVAGKGVAVQMVAMAAAGRDRGRAVGATGMVVVWVQRSSSRGLPFPPFFYLFLVVFTCIFYYVF